MPDGDVLRDEGREVRLVDVDHRVVLDVGAGADADLLRSRAEHRAVPDADVVAPARRPRPRRRSRPRTRAPRSGATCRQRVGFSPPPPPLRAVTLTHTAAGATSQPPRPSRHTLWKAAGARGRRKWSRFPHNTCNRFVYNNLYEPHSRQCMMHNPLRSGGFAGACDRLFRRVFRKNCGNFRPPSRPTLEAASRRPGAGFAAALAVRSTQRRGKRLRASRRRRGAARGRRPRARATSPARASGGPPLRFAEVAVSGPTLARSARSRGWSGTRTASGRRRRPASVARRRQHDGERRRPGRLQPRPPPLGHHAPAASSCAIEAPTTGSAFSAGPALEGEDPAHRHRVVGAHREPVERLGGHARPRRAPASAPRTARTAAAKVAARRRTAGGASGHV